MIYPFAKTLFGLGEIERKYTLYFAKEEIRHIFFLIFKQ